MRRAPPSAIAPPAFGAGYLRYAIGLLFAVNLLNVMDRMIMGILVEPIKGSLFLTDTQLSLVSGFSFVLFYLIAGVAISRRIDSGNRKLILTAGVMVWSLATALTGLAENFATLLVARVLVGAGEATAFPVAMSLIADYFSKDRRPRVVAVFQASNPIGVIAGAVMAGVIAQQHGWRSVFVLFGAVGVLTGLVFYATLREPVRGQLDDDETAAPAAADPSQGAGLFQAIQHVLRGRGFLGLCLGYGVAYSAQGILAAWAPAFLQRTHGLDIAQTGKVIGPAVGIGAVAGAILAGAWASRLVATSGNQRDGLRVTMTLLPVAAPCLAIFLLSPSLPVALVAVAVANFCIASVLGPPIALAVGLAPSTARALTSTLMLTAHAVLAGGAAPLLVGMMSDALQPSMGQDALRYAMMVSVFMPLLAWALFFQAFRAVGSQQASPTTGAPMVARSARDMG